ncbi:MAG: cupin domain-containing protein [Syntrophomonadaceae bacterium]|jgi:cupin 2 domain-containing protein
MNNILKLPNEIPDREVSEALIPDRGILIERIISTGQSSPPGFWYEQERDEWVVLLQGEAELLWENGRKLTLGPGDWVFISAGERHRVQWTSASPPCIWLAVHGKMA